MAESDLGRSTVTQSLVVDPAAHPFAIELAAARKIPQ